ncbi:hypothetical protein SAMN03159496_05590 [Rhizobium sp. NFR07]|nr:hypothetical protein SAMN03159496_05590 [Rhizobium sp. NFR07]
MEFVWKKGIGMKIAIAPRSILILSAVILGGYLPESLPRLSAVLYKAFSN